MRKFLSVAVALVAAVILTGSTNQTVSAQSSGLGITPRKDLVIQPGKTTSDQLQIINLNRSNALRLSLQVVDFGPQGETGTPALELDPEASQTPWSLKPFIKAPESITVAPGKTEYVKFSVNIPAGQGAGSYYSAIRYVAEGSGGGQVAISASGATLVFVTVPGKTKESLVVKKFGAYEMKKNSTEGEYRKLFVKSAPKEMAFTLRNQGNVAEQPAGSIQIKNMFGKEAVLVKNANPKASLALIDQTRRFQTCITVDDKDKAVCKAANLAPGRYTATLSAFYGINGNQTQDVTATASFWYLPVWFLILMGAIVIAIASSVYVIYRRMTGARAFRRR